LANEQLAVSLDPASLVASPPSVPVVKVSGDVEALVPVLQEMVTVYREQLAFNDKQGTRDHEVEMESLKQSTSQQINQIAFAQSCFNKVNYTIWISLVLLSSLVGVLLYLGRTDGAVGAIGVIGMLLSNWLSRVAPTMNIGQPFVAPPSTLADRSASETVTLSDKQ